MKTHKLWSWMALLASFVLVLQLSTIARAQDDDDRCIRGRILRDALDGSTIRRDRFHSARQGKMTG